MWMLPPDAARRLHFYIPTHPVRHLRYTDFSGEVWVCPEAQTAAERAAAGFMLNPKMKCPCGYLMRGFKSTPGTKIKLLGSTIV